MNKRIFGLKIGTLLAVIVSLISAVLFGLFVKYSLDTSAAELMKLVRFC